MTGGAAVEEEFFAFGGVAYGVEGGHEGVDYLLSRASRVLEYVVGRFGDELIGMAAEEIDLSRIELGEADRSFLKSLQEQFASIRALQQDVQSCATRLRL